MQPPIPTNLPQSTEPFWIAIMLPIAAVLILGTIGCLIAARYDVGFEKFKEGQ